MGGVEIGSGSTMQSLPQIVANALGLRPEDVIVRAADTDAADYDVGVGGGRTTVSLGAASLTACGEVRKKLFEKKCSVCHASETAEKRIGPSLRGVKSGRLPDSIGRHASHDNILKKINDGGSGMPVFRELLTPEEKEKIVAYVMTL